MSGSILPDVADGASISDADLFYSTQSGVDKKVTGAQIKAYATPPGTSALIASAIGVDLNTADDTAMTLSAFAAGKFFVVDYVLVTNPSIPLDTAVADVWSAAAGTGQQYSNVGAIFVDALVNPRDWVVGQGSAGAGPTKATLTSTASLGTMLNTAPIVNVNTPQGAAATADFYVYGRVFP